MNKNIIPIIIVLIIAGVWFFSTQEAIIVTNFDECIQAGNPAMESYPRQCRHGDETFTEIIEPIISQEEASIIARKNKDCSMAGIVTHRENEISYNAITKTWWFDIERMPEIEKDGCNPACVVNEETLTSEVNWRCTGLVESKEITCEKSQRNVDACTMDYTPVCGSVRVECFTTPCDPVKETFSNVCSACSNERVISYITGECIEN